MATHESWQFSFVKEKGEDVIRIPSLGSAIPLVVEQSSLNDGSILDPTQPTTVVNGEHNRLKYGFPSNPDGYTLTGNVEIYRKKREFPRSRLDSSCVLVLSTSLSSDRDTYFDLVDHIDSEKQNVWYYTIFYEVNYIGDVQFVGGKGGFEEPEVAGPFWAYSSIHSHDRAFVLKNGASQYGNKLYDYQPVGIRLQDESLGNNNLYKLNQIMGKALDEFREKLNHFSEKRFDIDNVDAAFLPYIDQMLGWPTNFELRENRRRKETANAISLWKGKGTSEILEFASQTLTGWDIEISEGHNYYLTTYSGEEVLDPNNPPADWDEQVDGVWADQVNGIPFNGTVDLTDPASVILEGGPNDNYRVIMESAEQGWKNEYGVLVSLVSQIQGEDPLLSDLAKDKLLRLINYLVIHYANTHIQVSRYSLEELALSFAEDFSDDQRRLDSSSLQINDILSTSWNAPQLHTYPHPDPGVSIDQNSTWEDGVNDVGRTLHAGIQ